MAILLAVEATMKVAGAKAVGQERDGAPNREKIQKNGPAMASISIKYQSALTLVCPAKSTPILRTNAVRRGALVTKPR